MIEHKAGIGETLMKCFDVRNLKYRATPSERAKPSDSVEVFVLDRRNATLRNLELEPHFETLEIPVAGFSTIRDWQCEMVKFWHDLALPREVAK